MFNKETYIKRRQELKKLVGNGVIVLFGNNDSPRTPRSCITSDSIATDSWV